MAAWSADMGVGTVACLVEVPSSRQSSACCSGVQKMGATVRHNL